MSSQLSGCSVLKGEYKLCETLGEGAFGRVKLGRNAKGDTLAVKVLDLARISRQDVRKELVIHNMTKHPNIVRFIAHDELPNQRMCIVLELVRGGELFDRIEPDEGMDVDVAHLYYTQLLSAVGYLHSIGVTHRDIKPENILLDHFSNVKLTDFGFATVFFHKGQHRTLTKRCGTAPYASPEVHREHYEGPDADLWSCQIVLVTMLAGCLPWLEPAAKCLEFAAWCSNDVNREPWSRIREKSPAASALLRHTLAPNIKRRWKLSAILEDPWLTTRTKLTRWLDDKGQLTTNVPELAVPEPRLEIGREDEGSWPPSPPSKRPHMGDDDVVKKHRARFLSTLSIEDTLNMVETNGSFLNMDCEKDLKANTVTFTSKCPGGSVLSFRLSAATHRRGVMVKAMLLRGDGIEFNRRLKVLRQTFGAVLLTQPTQATQATQATPTF